MNENITGKLSAVGSLTGVLSPGQVGGEDQLAKLATNAGSSADNPVSVELKTGGSEIFGIGALFRNAQSENSASTPSSLMSVSPRYFKVKLPKDATTIEDNAFICAVGLTEVEADLDNPVDIGERAFYCCSNLKTVGNLWSKLKSCKANSFSTRNSGGNYNFEANRNIAANEFEGVGGYYGSFSFNRCGFRSFTAPKCRNLGYSNAFANCANLVFADFSVLSSIPARTFANCASLTDLYLRNSEIVNLENVDAFTGTPIANGNGTIHVPADLESAYKAATNWNTYESMIVGDL